MVSIRECKTGYNPLKFASILKGVLFALVIVILGCAIFGIIYHITPLSENTLSVTASILFYLSLFMGSIYAACEVGYKGLFHGVAVAVLFIILAWFVAVVFFSFRVDLLMIIQKAVFSCVAGAAGGVLGVGLSKNN